jgi:hypothetical protein
MGFIAILSTTHQIIDFLFEIKMSFQRINLLCIDVIFLDKKDAFDNVKRNLLLQDMYVIGISDNCLKTIKSYLYLRK